MSQYLISAAEAIKAQNAVFFDASYHLPMSGRDADDEFATKRIKNAQRFCIDKIAMPSSPLPHTMPTAPIFERHMQNMGVNQDSDVIIYDDTPIFSAARAWFMFRYFGHEKVRILDGGLKQWIEAGGETESGAVTPPPRGDFVAKNPADDAGLISLNSMKKLVKKPIDERNSIILDARSPDRFYAQVEEPRAGIASGHMEGAINIPFYNLLDPETGKMKSPAELEEIFNGLDKDKSIVTTCGSGVTACALILGLMIIGRHNVTLYDGSWVEWGSQPDCPINY